MNNEGWKIGKLSWLGGKYILFTFSRNMNTFLNSFQETYPVGWFFFKKNFNSSAIFSGDLIQYSKTPGGSWAVN